MLGAMHRKTAFAASRVAWLATALSFAALSFAQTIPPAPASNLHFATPPLGTPTMDIPSLNWQPRSDWINVKSNVSPVAIGDGVADDTAALQAALNMTNIGTTVYIPAGTYRITQTLARHNNTGSTIIGNGRDTRIVWDGTNGGVMFWSDGNNYSRYIGLSWDGAGKAAIGFDHAAKNTFETEIQHRSEAYKNFTGYGIRIGNNQVLASSEILYFNCFFTNCANGIGALNFNDYDNTIDHCEFESCSNGITVSHGNFYARDSHFQNSTYADFNFDSEHGSSIRRCTSTGAQYFIYNSSLVAPLVIQDCRVANWTASDSAVHIFSAPVTMFDCGFTGGPVGSFPVKSTYGSQIILISSNTPSSVVSLISGIPANQIYQITNGSRTGVVTNANQTFLAQTATVPVQTFDAKRDFGAKGDGVTDDTTAIQSAINAARQYGQGAIAYLPTGRYKVSQTLSVTGTNYIIGGTGYRCGLIWGGSAGLPFVTVSNVQSVTLEAICVASVDFGGGLATHGDDILVGSTVPCRLTLDTVWVFGQYDMNPNRHGIHFDHLPADSLVVVQVMDGHIKIDGCDDANLLFRTSYEGTVTVKGTPSGRSGITGFLTRLATQENPNLIVSNNQSIVMSDFYIEQSQQAATFYGSTNESAGKVTIQGPKLSLNSTNAVFEIQGYNGRIYYGAQFYVDPSQIIFHSTNTPSLQFLESSGFWYNTTPVFNFDPLNVIATMGNLGTGSQPADSGINTTTMAGYASALDDLRGLGQLDNTLP
jgi:hypothetical protein